VPTSKLLAPVDRPRRHAGHRSPAGTPGSPANRRNAGDPAAITRSPSLTRPIVADTLAPVLARLAMHQRQSKSSVFAFSTPHGQRRVSGGACRQLASHLVAAWGRAGVTPQLPADPDAREHARRLVAMRCLCGLIAIPLPSRWRVCRCGWPRWRAIMNPLPTMHCAMAMR